MQLGKTAVVSSYSGFCMAVASGPAGPALAGPVFTVIFKCACAECCRLMNNEYHAV